MTDIAKSILVVDDENGIRSFLKLLLEEEGYNVYDASHGKQALDIFDSQQIDLLVTDIRMPQMDGFELAKTIKNIEPKLAVILISGGGQHVYAGKEYDIFEFAADFEFADALLKKPFGPDKLHELVRQFIANSN